MAAVTGAKLGYRPGLDGLRGLAVILVMAAHMELPGMTNGGAVGVTLFFVLSGFLITTLLVEEGEIDLRAFYARRARRLIPALAAILVVTAGMLTTGQVASIVLYVGNWVRASGDDLGVLNHTWSLAIEEQFYLVWPLVLIVLGRRALPVAVVGVVVSVVWRTMAWQDSGDTAFVYFSTFTRADAILAGCVLGFVQWRTRMLWPAVAVVVALSAVESDWFTYKIGFTAATLASVVAISAVLDRPGLMAHPLLGWFGRRSYGLYLWHTMLTFHFHPTGVDRFVVLALSLVVVEVSWRLIESPVMRWRVRSRSETGTPPVGPSPRSLSAPQPSRR